MCDVREQQTRSSSTTDSTSRRARIYPRVGRSARQTLGVTHFGAGSGGWSFVRIEIAPEHDTAVVAASNSGEAADAEQELITELLEEFAARK